MTESKNNPAEKPPAEQPVERPKPNVNAKRPGMVMSLESLDVSEKKK